MNTLISNFSTPFFGKAARVIDCQPDGNVVVFPVKDLDFINENSKKCAWYARSDDPQFMMKLGFGEFAKGWYMFECKIQSSASVANAKLYFEKDQIITEEFSCAVPYKSGSLTKRLVYVPCNAAQIRFDPSEAVGDLQIDSLKLTRVTTAYAKRKMVSELSIKHPKLKGKTHAEINSYIKNSVTEVKIPPITHLAILYNEVFTSSLHPQITNEFIAYQHWINKYEIPAKPSDVDVRDQINNLKNKPLISIVLPTYNSDIELLKECIDSVVNQSYQNWELCIADDYSTVNEVRDVLKSYTNSDKRIKVEFRDKNGHISAASNSALELVTGEYVALLDHDDKLADNALYYVARQINESPNAKLIYSDEDKIDESGDRCEPNFKPDWNPDLLNSQNYICHLAVYKSDLLKNIGGFRIGVEGSQDHDLLIRYTGALKFEEVVHIPKVLYHWRRIPNSTASNDEAKTYSTDAGLKALRDYLDSNNSDAHVESGMLPNTYRVRYPLGKDEPLVSLLIPTRDQLDVLSTCIESILSKTDYSNYEIIILDNQSSRPETLEYFSKISKNPKVKVIKYSKEFNYSAINNFGVGHANGSIIGLVNNDIEVISPHWLDEMVSHANRPEIGCVGAKLYYPDDRIQHAGVILGLGGVAGHSHKYVQRDSLGYVRRLKVVQNLSAVTAACLLVKKDIFHQVGGLNENELTVAFNDVDFCLRVREAGYRNLWTPYAELYHHESVSRGEENTPEKLARFEFEKKYMKMTWGEKLQKDPAYNPNLNHDVEDFSIAS